MTAPTDYTETRIKRRNLPDLLVHKFLAEYGYDHGPVIARAIVDDILTTIERCYPECIPPKTVIWLAVRREKQGQRKGLDITDLVPVKLLMVTEDQQFPFWGCLPPLCTAHKPEGTENETADRRFGINPSE